MSAPMPVPVAPRPLRVLIVEDNDGDAALIQQAIVEECTGSVLRPFVEIERVVSLSHARQAASTMNLDAVVLDLGLPDSQGIDTLRQARAFTDAAIVVLTGLSDEDVALQSLREGAQDYLFKGELSSAVALRALRYARERKMQQDALAQTRWLAGIGDTVLTVLHEINNPLTTLTVNAELLVSGDRDPAIPRAILESANCIADVTHRLASQRDPRSIELVEGMRMLDLHVS
jgi:phosphoserine phosphatase RsbU/P